MLRMSIITVCFNSVVTIRDTIESVLRQSYSEVEYIIVDGSSNDGTMNVISDFRDRIAVVVSEPDDGIYDAMNKAIRISSGDVIGFINADDFLATDYVLENIAKEFSKANIDICYGDLCYVREENASTVVRYWKSSEFKIGDFSKGWSPPHPTFYVRRNVFERYGRFDQKYEIAADFELMLRLMEIHKVHSKYIPSVLVKMRLGGTTNKSLINIVKQNREILRALCAHGQKVNPIYFLFHKALFRGKQFFMRPKTK